MNGVILQLYNKYKIYSKVMPYSAMPNEVIKFLHLDPNHFQNLKSKWLFFLAQDVHLLEISSKFIPNFLSNSIHTLTNWLTNVVWQPACNPAYGCQITINIYACMYVCRLHLDPLRRLSAPPDSLAVAGRKCQNKETRKRRSEEGKEKKGKGSCALMKFFMSILPIHSFSPVSVAYP